MAENTLRRDKLARDLCGACDEMRRWMKLDSTDIASMHTDLLVAMAEVAMQVYDATHLVLDERRSRERVDADLLASLERIAKIAGGIDVRA